MEPISLVIATFNEAAAIGSLIGEIPTANRRDIIIADGGSADAIQAVARAAGARGPRPCLCAGDEATPPASSMIPPWTAGR
jgi:glycosyltransferase involved in cell wall biosynthesis